MGRTVKERPIIFSGPMVRAILEGCKTQARRIVRRQPRLGDGMLVACPYGKPGDKLWVREVFGYGRERSAFSAPRFAYRADGEPRVASGFWKSPIHMPRSASRITLELTEVRGQRLQEVSEEDAIAEGVLWAPGEQESNVRKWGAPQTARMRFADLWDSINGKRAPWASNPCVWAITFRRVEMPASQGQEE